MKRKIIQLAGKTLVVSIPNKWVKEQGLKKGDEIEFIPQGKEAKLVIEDINKKLNIQVNLANTSEDAFKYIISALHRIGYDEIELRYDKPELGSVVQQMINDVLFGFMVYNRTSKSCIIRSVAQEQEDEFFNLLKRAFIVTVSMGEGITECMKKGRYDEIADYTLLEATNNQLTNLCERIIIKSKKFSYKDSCFLYVISWNLEKIADDYRGMCKTLEGMNSKLAFYKLVEEVNSLLRKFSEMLNKFDINKLAELKRKNSEVKKLIKEQMQKSSGNETIILYHVLSASVGLDRFVSSFVGLNSSS